MAGGEPGLHTGMAKGASRMEGISGSLQEIQSADFHRSPKEMETRKP
jgi:hypothetical protein